MDDKKRWSSGWRGMVLIGIALVMGANLAAPALGHIGTTISHIWSHIKPLADARYLRAGEIKFYENGPWAVNAGLGGADVGEWSDVVRIDSNGTGTTWAVLRLTAPRTLGRRTYALKSVRICYQVTAGDRIDGTSIYQHWTGATNERFADLTDRTSSSGDPFACYTVSPSPSIKASGSLSLVLKWVKNSTDDNLDIGGVLTTWRVAGQAASAPVSTSTGDDEGSSPDG